MKPSDGIEFEASLHAYGVRAADFIEHAADGLHDARGVADLEYRFSCTLLQHNPVLSQLFVHSLTPEEKNIGAYTIPSSCRILMSSSIILGLISQHVPVLRRVRYVHGSLY